MGKKVTLKKIKQSIARETKKQMAPMVDKYRLVLKRKPIYMPLFIWVGLIKYFFNVNAHDPIKGGDFDAQTNANVGPTSNQN